MRFISSEKKYEKFILHGMSHYKIGRLVVELHKPADTYHLQINFLSSFISSSG